MVGHGDIIRWLAQIDNLLNTTSDDSMQSTLDVNRFLLVVW